jgi:hypothetical protein
MATKPFELKTVEPKKPMEEMTDKELMAYCMKIKRYVSKEMSKLTPEERRAYYAAQRLHYETEYGIKYYSPPVAAPFSL